MRLPTGTRHRDRGSRYDFVAQVTEAAVTHKGEVSETMTDRIDRIVLNRWLGLPIFLLIMYVMFLFTQNVGGAFIDFFDILVGGVMVEGLSEFLASIGTPDWLRVFLANGVGGGLRRSPPSFRSSSSSICSLPSLKIRATWPVPLSSWTA